MLGKRQQEKLAEIRTLPNRELWEDFLDATVPDGWEGAFTDEGHWLRGALENELETRLANWLSAQYPRLF